MIAFLDRTPATLEWIAEITSTPISAGDKKVSGVCRHIEYTFIDWETGGIGLAYDDVVVANRLKTRGQVRMAIETLGISTTERFNWDNGELIVKPPEWLKVGSKYVYDLDDVDHAHGITVVGIKDCSSHPIVTQDTDGCTVNMTVESFLRHTALYRKAILGHTE